MKSMVFAAMLAGSSFAYAAPIVGTVSTNGVSSYNSDSISFHGAGNVGRNTATGDFTPAYDNGCAGCVQLKSFSYKNFVGPVVVESINLNDVVSTYTIEKLTHVSSGEEFLDVAGTGYATLTGYDRTPGTFYFSTQGGDDGMRTTFSTTEIVSAMSRIPEPASFAILGMSLMAVSMVRRRV